MLQRESILAQVHGEDGPDGCYKESYLSIEYIGLGSFHEYQEGDYHGMNAI